MFDFLKDSFLSIFVVGYRINQGAWPPSFNADAHKAVVAVAFVVMIAAFTIFIWAQILFDSRIELSKPVIALAAISIYAISYYLLVTEKIGSNFENRFDHFPKVKRVTLRIIALLIFFGMFALFLISVPYYQSTFHILPKS